MPPKGPITIARNPNAAKASQQANGILPVPGAALQNAANRNTRTPAARLKLEIRRLPPSLTLQEFEEALGEEWKLEKGKVDWMEYRAGKLKSLGKIPEQSRCYIHLTSEAHLKPFEARFLETTFHDARGTHKDQQLKNLPPTLGFAPNQKLPPAKNRIDGRQGTIDQDPEYQAFLEAETLPITKPVALDSNVVADKKAEKVTSTPLIDDLREKKANKAKAGADKAAKHAKTDAKDDKPMQKTEHAAKEDVKCLNKQTGKPQAATAQPGLAKGAVSPAKARKGAANTTTSANASPTMTVVKPTQASLPPSTKQRRERGNAEGIKKMLQKDLGLAVKPPQGPRNQTKIAAAIPQTSQPAAPPATLAKTSSVQPSAAPSPAQASMQNQPTPRQPPPPRKPAAPSPGSVKAYLKHANPSQGMTEVLISQCLAQYGPVVNVTIDPRKGTAIATFAATEGLKNAMVAKRVPVAQGAVEVMEFRDRPAGAGPSVRGRGGHRGGRGGRGASNVGGDAAHAAASIPVPLIATQAPPG